MDPESVVTTTLEERDGRTTLTSRIPYQSVESRDGHVNSGMEAGAAETFDRLAEHLGAMA
ncbi:MAG: SRPBCC domain-containing protein [Gemmatimonadaceae bacterium]